MNSKTVLRAFNSHMVFEMTMLKILKFSCNLLQKFPSLGLGDENINKHYNMITLV